MLVLLSLSATPSSQVAFWPLMTQRTLRGWSVFREGNGAGEGSGTPGAAEGAEKGSQPGEKEAQEGP